MVSVWIVPRVLLVLMVNAEYDMITRAGICSSRFGLLHGLYGLATNTVYGLLGGEIG